MRILFFISSMYGGGAERVLQLLANELVQRDYDVAICTNLTIPFAYSLNKKIALYDLNINSRSILKPLLLLKRIKKVVNIYNPNVVVSFMAGMNRYVITSLLFTKYPVIASEHCTFFSFKEEKNLLYYIERYYINKLANKVTVLTKRDYDYIGNRLSNKVVVPNPSSFTAIPYYNEKEREKTILLCGSLSRCIEKGFDKMIILWSEICDKYPEWTLQIAGSGDSNSTEYLKSIIKDHQVENQVQLLGFQKEVNKIMKKASIFVIASKTEGFPMTLIEAMSQGCACISFDCEAGPREIISSDCSNGILVEDQNWYKMKECLQKMIEYPNWRKELAINAIKNTERFSLTKIVTKWENLFNEVAI